MQYGAGSAVNVSGSSPSFFTDLYLSGTTSFTLGLGDVVPRSGISRFLVVVESGFGFGFLAAVIGYLPFIYGSFAERETEIVLLDARAGTPPTAGELLLRHTFPGGHDALRDLFKDWERWSAQLLNARSASIGGGTNEIVRNVIAERALGLPRDVEVDVDVPFRSLKVGTQREA